MPRYVAFLRAINVGSHVVKMERLRVEFEAMGLAKVETFIASGNVVFESRSNERALERKIEQHLREALGYEVATFVRSQADLAAIAAYEAFPSADDERDTLYIAFLSDEPSKDVQGKVLSYPSKADEFRFHRRELYWLCHTRFSDSEFSGARLEKLIGLRATVRNANTIQRLVAKYPLKA